MSDQNSTNDGESDPQHSLSMVFLLVLVFFIMGLVGFLICHVLKKKGYRCRTFRDELDPDNKDVLAELQASECWGDGSSAGAWALPFARVDGCSLNTLLGWGWEGLPVMCCWVGKSGWGGESSVRFHGDVWPGEASDLLVLQAGQGWWCQGGGNQPLALPNVALSPKGNSDQGLGLAKFPVPELQPMSPARKASPSQDTGYPSAPLALGSLARGQHGVCYRSCLLLVPVVFTQARGKWVFL